jgi:PII-like signaling protein
VKGEAGERLLMRIHIGERDRWKGRLNLPIVVECVDTEDRIAAILTELDRMIGGGLVTLEKVPVRLHRPHTEPRCDA